MKCIECGRDRPASELTDYGSEYKPAWVCVDCIVDGHEYGDEEGMTAEDAHDGLREAHGG